MQSRFRLKNIINTISNSNFKEQKSYNLKDVSIYIKNETKDLFNIVYAILSFDRVIVNFNKDVSSNFIAKILTLFPILEYSDDCIETLKIDYENYNNSLLYKFMNESIQYNIDHII